MSVKQDVSQFIMLIGGQFLTARCGKSLNTPVPSAWCVPESNSMNKPISRPLHGLAEATYIPAVALAPKLGGFEENKTATTLCYAISGSALLSSLFTRAEWGVVRIVPFKMHLALDAITGLLALGVPKLLNFENNHRARNAFLLMGLTALVVSALTQPDEMENS